MKKLFAVLILFSLPLAPVCAQGLHGKILIFGDSTKSSISYNLLNLLPTIYSGTVDIMSVIPGNLENYDAIFLFPEGQSSPSDTLTYASELNLISYIQGGGKVYAENFAGNYHGQNNSLSNDTLWHFLGLEFEAEGSIEVWFDRVYGVDSEFSYGIDISWVHSDPLQFDAGGVFGLGGMTPVLFIHEGNDGVNDEIAWIPVDTSKHAVLYYPEGEGYDLFLTRVTCDYFGLCADAVHEAPPESEQAISVQVVYDGSRTDLQISGDAATKVDVTNSLGVVVYHTSTQSGTSLVEIPATLPDGFYFARVHSERGVRVEPFGIFAR